MVSLEYIAFEHNNAAAELVKLAYDTPPLAFVHSYGCQQNVNDGERIKGVLMDIGYGLCDKPEDADLILFNTCAVREHAEQRVFGNVGALKGLKEKKPGLIIGLCGCMANQKHVVEKLRQSLREQCHEAQDAAHCGILNELTDIASRPGRPNAGHVHGTHARSAAHKAAPAPALQKTGS